MSTFRLALVLFCALGGFCSLSSAQPLYEFDGANEEKAFYNLLSQFRCPQCEAQSLAESPSPVAQSLRQQIYAMFRAGKSAEEISAYLSARYGEEVLMLPSSASHRFFLWGLPLLLLFALCGSLFFYLYKGSYKKRYEVNG